LQLVKIIMNLPTYMSLWEKQEKNEINCTIRAKNYYKYTFVQIESEMNPSIIKNLGCGKVRIQ
jgi:hypothetical protein